MGLERLRFGLEVTLPVADDEEGRGARVRTEVDIVNGSNDMEGDQKPRCELRFWNGVCEDRTLAYQVAED